MSNQTDTTTTEPALKACPFCGATPSPYPTGRLPAHLHDVAHEWFDIQHHDSCFIALLGFGNQPIHQDRLAAWGSRASAASAAPTVTKHHASASPDVQASPDDADKLKK